MLAATPAWFADNLTEISAGTLLLLVLLVVRLVQKAAIRMALLALIAVVGVLVYVNRGPLEACAKTCKCDLGGRHVTVPTCNTDLKL